MSMIDSKYSKEKDKEEDSFAFSTLEQNQQYKTLIESRNSPPLPLSKNGINDTKSTITA